MNNQVINGLKPLPPDSRDFKLGEVFTLPKLEELPDEYIAGLPTIVNQKNSDFCAAAASCAVSELQEETPLGFEWVFAVAKMLEGDVESFGTDLRTICKVHTKYGAPERKELPFTLENKDPDFLRRIENYPSELYTKALKHKKGSYFAVVNAGYDYFDAIRATMWKFKNEKIGVVFGVIWSWSLSQISMDSFSENGSGHALSQIGWKGDYMFIQNSYGVGVGELGRHYFSREVINAFVKEYGAFMFHDMPVEQAQNLVDNGIKFEDNWLTGVIKAIGHFIKDILDKILQILKDNKILMPKI